MKMHGQRWYYESGNNQVRVENAFSWSGWSQERLVVNNEVITKAEGWFRFRNQFTEPFLTRLGGEDLVITMIAGLMDIKVSATLGGKPFPHTDYETAVWEGPQGWWPD